MSSRPVYGRAYGDWLEAAMASAARGSAISCVGFETAEAAVSTAAAFERMHHVLARHLRFVAGPNRTDHKHPTDVAAQELAAMVEAVAGRYGKDRTTPAHPAARAWNIAADALGAAHDILATHVDPDSRPLTLEGELVLHPEVRWHGVVCLAELAQLLDQQRTPLLRQLATVGALPGRSGMLALHRARLEHDSIEKVACAVLDTARDHPGRPGLDRVDLAPLTVARDLPDDPLERTLALTDSLRRFAYEQASDGGGLGTDGLRSYAALAVDITGHAITVLRAADARVVDLFGHHVGTLARPGLTRGIAALRQAGRHWTSVYRRWDDITSLEPTPRLLHRHVALTRLALSAITRDDHQPKHPADLLADTTTATRCIDATGHLIGRLAPLAQHQLATAQRMQAAGHLLALVVSDEETPTGARHASHAPLTYWPFERIRSAYLKATTACTRATAELEPLHEGLASGPAARAPISQNTRQPAVPTAAHRRSQAPTPPRALEIGL
jgi:hypothetical protein